MNKDVQTWNCEQPDHRSQSSRNNSKICLDLTGEEWETKRGPAVTRCRNAEKQEVQVQKHRRVDKSKKEQKEKGVC